MVGSPPVTLSAAVRKRLSREFVLDALLTLSPGITILFGASGSGKSTLLRCLAGLATPDTGRIAIGERVLFDSDLRIDCPAQERQSAYVFQQLALFPHMSARENIAFGLHGADRAVAGARIDAIARSFRIESMLDRKPGALSGGERQRVALARSLVTDPGFLLLDEPLSALDHAAQNRIIGDLRQWNADHQIPILYVTHSHREVFALGERVLLLEQGLIVADGPPHQVMNAPTRESVARAAGFENLLDATVTHVRRDAGTMECRLHDSATDVEVPLFDAPVGERIRLALRAGDILIASELPRGLSARNVLPGTVVSLSDEGPSAVVTVDAGARFEVHVTLTAVHELGLAIGAHVWLVIKTHSFHHVHAAHTSGNIST